MDKSLLLERLYNNLPKNFRNADANQKLQLKRYLDILVSGGFNPLHEETKGILNFLDFDKIPFEHLPLLASDLGFRFPYDLDEQTQRTYIRNAVTSYRMKGTKKALLFMLRELTRFKVNVNPNEDEKTLSVTVEVTDDRQDIENLRDKVSFIINEYAPPYRHLAILNVFVWDEFFDRRNIRDEISETYLYFYSSHDEDEALYFNHHQWAILNSVDYNLSNFQQYDRNRITYYENIHTKDALDEDLYTPKDDSELRPIRINHAQGDTLNRAHQKDSELITITDEGLGTISFHEGIILNQIDYGMNRIDRRLGDVEIIDLQVQHYDAVNRVNITDVYSLRYVYEEIYTAETTYYEYRLDVIFKPIEDDYVKSMLDEALSNIKIVTNETLSRAKLETIVRNTLQLISTEAVTLDVSDVSLISLDEEIFTESAVKQFLAEQKLDHVKVVTSIKDNFLFILSDETSTTQSENNQISGTIERWLREKYAIIGKGNQTEFTNQETYDSMETQDDFTDTIIYPNED